MMNRRFGTPHARCRIGAEANPGRGYRVLTDGAQDRSELRDIRFRHHRPSEPPYGERRGDPAEERNEMSTAATGAPCRGTGGGRD